MTESRYDTSDVVLQYKCQFCGQSSPIAQWTNRRQTCPKCGRDYDWRLAQDSE